MVSNEIAKEICKEILQGSLQCDICCRFLFPNKQCASGHTICATCLTKVKSCPFCRRRSRFSENLALTSIASSFPVRCAAGCGYTGSPQDMVFHLSECERKTFECPTRRVLPNLSSENSHPGRQKVCRHFVEDHPHLLIKENKMELKFDEYFYRYVYNSGSSTICADQCFYMDGNVIQLWLQVSLQKKRLRVALMFYGPEIERYKYQCLIRLMVSKRAKQKKFVWCAPYSSTFEEIPDNYVAEFCFTRMGEFHLEMINNSE
ncbi:uncharacterized protein LOC123315544 [Coccinella septempunctata]|uniref:uncharacterized protein LOC123315544 n=1 Tax=Coccinella septempunctata TaxID=41139 RepID=UPI001D090A75|nr:uncharacterized protein LOC123315544 [Coccinella septempunctata]